MNQNNSKHLEALSEEKYHKARFALEAIDVRARDFTVGLDNEQELRQIIIRAFAVVQKKLLARKNNTALQEDDGLFFIKEDLMREQRMTSNNADSYKAVYFFIEAAEKTASISSQEITSDHKSLRDLAMNQVGMPIERI